jgi:hypothetical protein
MKLPDVRLNFAERIGRDPNFRRRVLLALYGNQTSREQSLKKTQDLNDAGFSAADAGVLSASAEKLLAGESLSRSECWELQERLPKYWGQFLTLQEPPRSVGEGVCVSVDLVGASEMEVLPWQEIQ